MQLLHGFNVKTAKGKLCTQWIRAVMLKRPAGHEAKAEAEARKSEAEDEAEAQKIFRGRGQTR